MVIIASDAGVVFPDAEVVSTSDGFIVSSSNDVVVMLDEVVEPSISLVVIMFAVEVITFLGEEGPTASVVDLTADINVVTPFGMTATVVGVITASVVNAVSNCGVVASIDGGACVVSFVDDVTMVGVDVGSFNCSVASFDTAVVSVCDVPNA